jgi:hypothetical protein
MQERNLNSILRKAAILCGLILLTGIVYFQTRTFEFVSYDDDRFVTENPHLKEGLELNSLRWAVSAGLPFADTKHADYWRPLSFLSHVLDVEFWGMNAGAHHSTNVAIHILAVIGPALLSLRFLQFIHCMWNPSPGFPNERMS